jgi:hypothetical protein
MIDASCEASGHETMTDLENEILRALVNLEKAVDGMKAPGPKPDLAAHFAAIDGLAARLPRNSNPDLLHFLQKKSYQKARLLLEGAAAQAPRGACPR